ncbi:Protein ORANGE-ORANGE, chloroplastic [Vitis vinifera]|uniref:Protein ORANGE-ORANGE, chloroplastic n=1 Tax=Vitis vinifera TaxID=29760 RepID=A0A438INP0_VITVI|nr:Protein ORANGE-ORANGE, chloroplastic [Vitis vinifera]
MVCTGRILAVSYSPTTSFHRNYRYSNSRFLQGNLKSNLKWRSMASEPGGFFFCIFQLIPILPIKLHWRCMVLLVECPGYLVLVVTGTFNTLSCVDLSTCYALNAAFVLLKDLKQYRILPKWNCKKFKIIFEVGETKIFLHMEEVRRLRIQQRIKNAELGILKEEQENELPNFPSFIPFLPPLSSANLKLYYATCFSLIAGIIIFGGLLAPTLELKLGLGGTSYEDFIRSVHLPMQLRCLKWFQEFDLLLEYLVSG